MSLDVEALNQSIVSCVACPRLVEWREQIAKEKRRAFQSERYWGRPVPCFGDFQASRLIVGLAPAAHGANRTGRMFTGDRSGEWLYRALFKAGVASQPECAYAGDGLSLSGVLITAVVHCAPPANKPTKEEIASCEPYLSELVHGRRWNAVLCLGALAWDRVFRVAGGQAPNFSHGVFGALPGGTPVIGSYHPSQQNTFTGRLTEAMLDEAIARFLASQPEDRV